MSPGTTDPQRRPLDWAVRAFRMMVRNPDLSVAAILLAGLVFVVAFPGVLATQSPYDIGLGGALKPPSAQQSRSAPTISGATSSRG